MTQIPAGWRKITAEEYCLKVADWTHDSPKPTDEWFFLATSKNIKNWILDLSSAYKISSSDFEQINKRSKVDKRDILFSMIWTVWEVCLLNIQPNFAIKNVWLLKCWEKEKSQYLYYYLKSPFAYHYVISRLNGTTHKYITLWDLRSLPIHLPLLQEQQAIAAVLSSFDDKIELLRAENQTLEQMGQELFKERFGKWKVGDVLPEGWRVGKLGEEFDVSIGRTPPRAESEWFSNKPIGKKWISIKDMVNSWIYIFNTSEFLTDEAIAKFNIPIIPNNTTILSFKMTVGKLAITTEDMLSNEAIAHFKLKSNSVLSSEFIYCYLSNLDFNSLWSTSSIVTAINSTIIKELSCIIPDQETLSKFDLVIKPLFNKIRANSEQIQTLSSTRDQLLPKLMSGEVRVEF